MFEISKKLIGYNEILNTLKSNIIKKSLHHSLIFYGNKGIGKNTFFHSEFINKYLVYKS